MNEQIYISDLDGTLRNTLAKICVLHVSIL